MNIKKFLGAERLLAVVAAAGLMSLAFEPVNFWWVAFFGFVPCLLIMLKEAKAGTVMAEGFLWGFVFYGWNARWFWNIFAEFSLFLWALLAFYGAIFALVFWLIKRRFGPVAALMASPLFWVGIEWFRSEGHYLKFAWLSPGFSQSSNLPLVQFASVLGVYGLSFLVVGVNASVALLVMHWKERCVRIVAACFIGGVMVIELSGWILLRFCPDRGDMPVALVQTETASFHFNSFFSRKAPAGTRLIVWPEYGVFDVMDASLQGKFEQLASQQKAVIVAGCKSLVPGGNGKTYNSAAIIDPERGLVGLYHKANPVQFFDDGVPGKEFPVFDTPAGKLGVAICYDMDFPKVFRSLVAHGAEILVVPTFDAESWGKLQHLQHSALAPIRAVEVRRWVVRCASTGTSQVIDPHGRIHASMLPFKQGLLTGNASLSSAHSFYSLGGWLFGPLCAALTGLYLVAETFIVISRVFARRKN